MRKFITTWIALWTAIIAGAVFGRIIEQDKEQVVEVEELSLLSQEQARIWSNEFFRPSRSIGTSHIEYMPTSPLHTSRNLILRQTTNRSERYYSTFSKFPTDTSSHFRIPNNYMYRTNLFEDSYKRPTINSDNLEKMLGDVFNYPRSHTTNETAKNIVKKYIADSFQITSGIDTMIQYFKPVQFLSIYENDIPLGGNIVGIIKGTTWSTSEDRPIVIGAHYDTVNFTPGTDDNGSGCACMLEVARAIAHSECITKYSIIFVAFDLEETGSQGSLMFIKEYLMKILSSSGLPNLNSFKNFQGAFIMDTIMNFNDTVNSQTFPTDWSLVVPDVYDEVADEHFKGDFISMIYRKEVDNTMAEKFKYHWAQSDKESMYKIKGFPLTLGSELPELAVLADHLNFLRSDHARFWYMNDTEVPYTLKAMLITDTGPYRGVMRNCYHTVCDGPEISVYENPRNMKFLSKISQVLTDTVVDMSQCQVRDNNKHLQNFNVVSKGPAINRRRGLLKNSSEPKNSLVHNIINIIKWIQSHT